MNHELEPGTKLSHYRVESKIGAGGMGEVYLAWDTRLDRKVAIKFLHEELSQDIDKLNRFKQEAKAASALNHPNIMTVYEIGEVDGKNYIATEWIEGKTLRQSLSPKEPIALKMVFKVMVQVAEALAAAHQAGIIHRDIKPENIMIREDGYAKLLDFGLAKLTEQAAASASEEVTRIQINTTPGIVMGTVSYMSPEQARGRLVDPRSDLFSLGVILYELLANRRPFTGKTTSHELVAILEKTPAPIASSGYVVPADLETITMRLLEKDVERRYQTAREVVADLKALRKRLEFEAELERTSSPDAARETATRIFSPDTTPQNSAVNSIAVMPFVNMSSGEDGDYFSDGLAEELLNVLSKIRGFRVAARTSAFSFKGKQATITDIGEALNVASVLEGSIRTAGNRVRISVQLINVADGYHIWSETYDRMMDDIFAVQDDIAQSVVEELRARLLGEKPGADTIAMVEEEVAEAVKGRAANPEAQRLMLLGRYFLDRTNPDDARKAISFFREALDLDSEYALGWAELGRTHAVQAGKSWVPVDQGYADARRATERALELEPDLADGHAILGRIQAAYDWDLTGAMASYEKALELAPGSSLVLDGASILKFKLGHFDEALELSRRVLAQDPLSGAIWHNLGLMCHAAGLLAESEKAFRRALELSPQRQLTTAMLALVLLDQGRSDEAAAYAANEPDEVWRLWAEAIIFHETGLKEEADAALGTLKREFPDGNAYQIAEVCAMRGESDEAFTWLDRAIAERDPGVTHTKADPRFRPLNNDPRWPALLRQIGFDS